MQVLKLRRGGVGTSSASREAVSSAGCGGGARGCRSGQCFFHVEASRMTPGSHVSLHRGHPRGPHPLAQSLSVRPHRCLAPDGFLWGAVLCPIRRRASTHSVPAALSLWPHPPLSPRVMTRASPGVSTHFGCSAEAPKAEWLVNNGHLFWQLWGLQVQERGPGKTLLHVAGHPSLAASLPGGRGQGPLGLFHMGTNPVPKVHRPVLSPWALGFRCKNVAGT